MVNAPAAGGSTRASIDPVGIGVGGGCVDCAIVPADPRYEMGAPSRRSAETAAARPLVSRSVATIRTHVAPAPVELSPSAIRHEMLREVLADAVRCYTQRANENTLPPGRMVVHFSIGPDGRVDEADVVSSSIHDTVTERCVTNVISGHAFPLDFEGASVTYPFVFSTLAPET